jgi:ubiquitin-protein ligase E3 C
MLSENSSLTLSNPHHTHQNGRLRSLTKHQLAQISPRLGILNNIPFAIPFETRVRIFREFIYNDKVGHGGGGEFGGDEEDDEFGGMGGLRMRLGMDGGMGMGRGKKTNVQVRRGMVSQDGFDRLADADLKAPVRITFIDQFGQEE